jgi:hypothetical protein
MSSSQDFVGRSEDLSGRLLWDLGAVQPGLYVAARVLCAFQAKRFQTQKRNRFSFGLAQASGEVFAIREAVIGVTQLNMANFMEKRLVGKRRRNRSDAPREPHLFNPMAPPAG